MLKKLIIAILGTALGGLLLVDLEQDRVVLRTALSPLKAAGTAPIQEIPSSERAQVLLRYSECAEHDYWIQSTRGVLGGETFGPACEASPSVVVDAGNYEFFLAVGPLGFAKDQISNSIGLELSAGDTVEISCSLRPKPEFSWKLVGKALSEQWDFSEVDTSYKVNCVQSRIVNSALEMRVQLFGVALISNLAAADVKTTRIMWPHSLRGSSFEFQREVMEEMVSRELDFVFLSRLTECLEGGALQFNGALSPVSGKSEFREPIDFVAVRGCAAAI